MRNSRKDIRKLRRRDRLIAGAKKHQHVKKPHPTPLKEKWKNSECAMVGFLSGRGESSTEISNKLGLDAKTVNLMINYWNIPASVDRNGEVVIVPILIGKYLRSKINAKAFDKKMLTSELIAAVMTVLVKDDLWGAVLDDE